VRLPPAFDCCVPVESAPIWAERALCLVALSVMVAHTNQVTWPLVIAALFLLPSLARWARACSSGRRRTAMRWWLSHDGRVWAWQLQSTSGEREGQQPLLAGAGQLQWVLTFGPWWLLRATALGGQGQSAWIWIRGHRLGVLASRLRTRLNWT